MVAKNPATGYRSPEITTESHTVHDTAREHGRLFFQLYGSEAVRTVVELGSQDVNGALRDHCPPGVLYIGLDVMPAKGVDLVIRPDASLPLASGCADAVVTSSAFEHDICFWGTFLELVRILRPGGLLYINVPSNGPFHRYPLDCWRFYPDAGVALARWAIRNGTDLELLESFIGVPQAERWGDFVAVFRKPGGLPLTRHGCIADHAAAFNVYDRDSAPEAPLRAESVSMPDMMIGEATQARLQAQLDASAISNAALEASLASTTQANQILSADLDEERQRGNAFAVELAAAQSELAALRQSLDTAQQRIHALEHDLAGVRCDMAKTDRELLAIKSSTSWRLMAGPRCLARFLRERRGLSIF